MFIHGFASCGWGEKSLALRRYFGIENLIAPDLRCRPADAVDQLAELIARYPVRALVGSSLGGFYATCLNTLRPLPTVLINPVVRPHLLLRGFLGWQRRWCDGAPFHVGIDYLEMLETMQRERLAPDEHYLVLLQQGDEVLDYRQAADFYRDKDLVQLPGGSHRFEDLGRCLPQIEGWLRAFEPAKT